MSEASALQGGAAATLRVYDVSPRISGAKLVSKRVLEWLFILNGACSLTTCIGANVLGIAELVDAGIVFAGTAMLFYMLSRVAR